MAVMITMSKSAAAAKKYFAEHLRQSDYLSQDGARAGVWFGKGAERLGLAGEVAAEDFGALASNRDPRTGKRLSVRDVANARPGYDFTFSGPKSFAAMWARTGDERLIEEFRASILETIAEDIEPEMKTRLRRRGQNGDVVTGNLVGSLFLHDTTRPLKEDGKPDPHPHGHAYIFAKTWAEHEKRWQNAQLFDLHLDRPYIEAAFEARLGARLRKLGYELEADGKGSWEIVGVPTSVNEKFSRRTRKEIEPEAKRRGITDPAEKAQLASRTRQKKGEGDNLATPELHAYWNSRLTSDEAAAIDAAHAQAQAGGVAGQPRVTAAQAVEHALEHFFGADGRNSAEAEKAVLEEALRYSAGAVLPADATRELAGRDLIRAELGGRMVCTTEEVHREEQAMSKSAKAGRNACAPLDGGKPYIPQEQLDQEQHAAIRQLLTAPDRIQMLLGKSGAGKTTTLRGFEAALRERQRGLTCFAPTTKARDTLREKGFRTAETLQALLARPQLQDEARGTVILIDEAGMAGTRALRQVFDLVEKQRQEGYDTRVLLVGDPMQHRGVPRGQVLHILQDQAGITPAQLTTVRRQKDPDHRKAVELLSVGRTGEAFDLLDKIGFIQEIADPEERYRAMAKDYADRLTAGESEMIISPTHAEGRAALAAVREELRARGQLGAEDRTLVRFESKDRSIAQRKEAAQYEAGDTVQWNQHAPGFKRGERVTVVGRQDGRVMVQNGGGQVKELPLALAERFELYRTVSLAVADGERLRVTRNGCAIGPDGKQHWLSNGDQLTVHFTPEGEMVDQRGWRIPASYGHLAYGVVTSHGSQSGEDEVPFLAQSGLSRGASSAQQFYVSVSRGTKSLRVYTDDKEALRAAVLRSEPARSAAEVWQARQAQRRATERAGWEQLARRQRRRRSVLAAARAVRDRLAGEGRQTDAGPHQHDKSRGMSHAQS
jgi:conjugative relaxase-like TrwC/TraI family protein